MFLVRTDAVRDQLRILADEFEQKADKLERESRRERCPRRTAFTFIMTDIVEYLYEKARELCEFMLLAPEIKGELLRIAQELEDQAANLAKDDD